MPDEDIVESKVNAQTLPPARKPTEETLQVLPDHEPSTLQLPDVAQPPDLQPASPGVPPPVCTRSGRIVRRSDSTSGTSPPRNPVYRLCEQF